MTATTILYPYCAKLAAGDELRLSLRSLARYLDGNYEVVLIGDVPHWYAGASIAMPRLTMRQYRALTGQRFHHRWHGILDVLWKFCAAAQCPEVSEDFVVVWDDTYFFNRVSTSYLLKPRYLGDIPDVPPRKNDFWDMMQRTRKRLLKEGFSIRDFATHHPFPLSKKDLAEYCARWNPFIAPGSTHTQFHNWLNTPAERIRPDDFAYFNAVQCESFAGELPDARIVNIAIVTPAIESHLAQQFDRPSPWERSPVMADCLG